MDHGHGISSERGLDKGGQVLSRGKRERRCSKENTWKLEKKISITWCMAVSLLAGYRLMDRALFGIDGSGNASPRMNFENLFDASEYLSGLYYIFF